MFAIVLRLASRSGFPYYVQGTRYVFNDGDWGGGFLIGLLWHLWQQLPERREEIEPVIFRKIQELAPLRFRKTFDVGFMFYYAAVRGYLLTGSEQLLRYAKDAVETLKSRFHPTAELIYHDYNRDEKRRTGSIIDTLPNIALLWWAAQELGDTEAAEIARSHTAKITQYLVRDNGAVYQAVWFDPVSGELLLRDNPQGFDSESVWTRGQAWGVLGFAQAYSFTRDTQYLELAQKLAAFFVQQLNPDGTCPWDFAAPDRNVLDNSALSIFLAATRYFPGFEQERQKIKITLQPFILPHDKEGLLDAQTFYKHRNEGVMTPAIWGDFFLVEGWEEQPLGAS